MLSLPAQPRPNNAVDPAARRAFALSSTRPTTELSGAAVKPRYEAKYTTRVRLSDRLGGAAERGSRGCMAFALCFSYFWRNTTRQTSSIGYYRSGFGMQL